MPTGPATGERFEASSGLAIRGLRIDRPLVRVSADTAGVTLMPRWRWLGWFLFRECGWLWSDVRSLATIVGPRGGVHGVRVFFAGRLPRKRMNGLLYPWMRRTSRLSVGLTPESTNSLLALAPSEIPRTHERGVVTWR
jgi:hypothetical protein